MSAKANQVLARRYYAEVANAELASAQASAAQLLAPDFTFYLNSRPAQTGIEAHQRFWAGHHATVADAKFTCEELVAQGDRVVCRLRVEGIQQGVVAGIAPSGRRFSIQAVDFFRVTPARGTGFLGRPTRKIAEIRRYLMLEQLRGEAEAEPATRSESLHSHTAP